MKVKSYPMPETRDPFCNNPPVPVGFDKNNLQQFWITTYNANVGPTGVLVNEEGEYKIYRWEKHAGGYYSAVPDGRNALWLCGRLSFMLRLDLRTGRVSRYDTGLPPSLVFYGMIFDPDTGKTFALSYIKYEGVGLSFDTVKRRVAKVYRNLSFSRGAGFRNPDGTWTIVSGHSNALIWDPRNDTVAETKLKAKARGPQCGFISAPVTDGSGMVYLSGLGWLKPGSATVRSTGPRPEREAIWFGRKGSCIWGAVMRKDDIDVMRWDMKTGKVDPLCTVNDSHLFGVAATESGSIIAVNMFGVFTRHNGDTGLLECSRELPVSAVGRMDCVRRIDDERILGTPYISQRFWEINTRTGQGMDCGRVAPGVGEVLQTCRVRGRVYMAVYTGGELVEYDPERAPRFPENPRVVATPPDSKRPVTMADNGRMIWYACSRHGNRFGSVLTRYDTVSGKGSFVENPLPKLQIRGLWSCPSGLFSGSAIQNDSDRDKPPLKQAVYARFNPETLKVEESVPAPAGVINTYIAGPLGRARFFVVCVNDSGNRTWGVLRACPLRAPVLDELRQFPVNGPPHYAGRPGFFVFADSEKVELWDMNKIRRVKTLYRKPAGEEPTYKCSIQDNRMLLLRSRDILVGRSPVL